MHNLCPVKLINKNNKQHLHKASGPIKSGLEIVHLKQVSEKPRSFTGATTTGLRKEKRHYYSLGNVAK